MNALAPAGNVSDKYGTRNPVARGLVRAWVTTLDELVQSAAPASLLDAGCGEGVHVERWARRLELNRAVGIDSGGRELAGEWARRSAPSLELVVADAGRLPFEDEEFDLVTAIELLEHVEDPHAVLAELVRCASRHVLLSVPREPLWRVLNVARGAYLRRLGDTPGHRSHWSRRQFCDLAARHGTIKAVRSPLPWTVVLLELG